MRDCVNEYVAEHTAKGLIRGFARADQQSLLQNEDLIRLAPTRSITVEGGQFSAHFRSGELCIGEIRTQDDREEFILLNTKTLKWIQFHHHNNVRGEPCSRESVSPQYAIYNNKLYMFGGLACWYGLNDMWVFDLMTLTWREIAPASGTRGNDCYWEIGDEVWPHTYARFSFVDRDSWYLIFFHPFIHECSVWTFNFVSEQWTREQNTIKLQNGQRLFSLVHIGKGQCIARLRTDRDWVLVLVDLKERSWEHIGGLKPFTLQSESECPVVTVEFDAELRRNVFWVLFVEGVRFRLVTWK
eukprot:c15992_g1_i1.p1 GENE.c15992_g1_i1~~c15992_g1_i1.p1  ORF type:complete len:348 (+),score=54.34 c15992_g1_i1:148-1044(+)